NLWLGTQGGRLIKWNYQQGVQDVESGFQLIRQTGLIRKIISDKQGFIWVATEGKGLYRMNPLNHRIIQSYSPDSPSERNRLGGVTAFDIMQYNDSIFIAVVGTLDIINTNTNSVQHMTKTEGFPNKSAYCGVVDDMGIVWIGTTDCICRVNIQQKIFTIYNRDDGIINDNLFLRSAFNLSAGRIAFTTTHDFFVFDPNRIVQKNIPTPKLTSFSLEGETLAVDSLEKEENIVLPYDKNSIQFAFSTLNFLQRKKLRYYYKLEGLDKNWRVANELNQAIYNYLPPGEYHIRIKAENADGVSSETFKSFIINIRPPFWKTWWFIGLLILITISLLLLMDRERMRRLAAMQQMRSQIASDLHGEINTTLNNINILSEMAKLKAEKDVVRSKEYIEQISEKSSNMIIAMDDMLWSLAPENDSMRETHLRFQEFADAMRSRYGVQVHLVVDSKVEDLQMDMKIRHELFLILKLALRLMIEDGNGRDSFIHIDYAKSKLYVKMKDEEVRLMAAKPVTKKRIDEIKKRASVIGAELDILDNQNGIIIVLILPLV
ncbi:MAG TPA: triple tyrosine motif-containing protein, partial [Flavisolibacter sp.]|nr:triple tyrosine motif-containing protein [Flavisolibacter sp.]